MYRSVQFQCVYRCEMGSLMRHQYWSKLQPLGVKVLYAIVVFVLLRQCYWCHLWLWRHMVAAWPLKNLVYWPTSRQLRRWCQPLDICVVSPRIVSFNCFCCVSTYRLDQWVWSQRKWRCPRVQTARRLARVVTSHVMSWYVGLVGGVAKIVARRFSWPHGRRGSDAHWDRLWFINPKSKKFFWVCQNIARSSRS